VHDIAAHLAAGAKEVADLVEHALEGRGERPTRAFDEREAPFRAMPYEDVLDHLVIESKRKLRAYTALDESAHRTIAFTGTRIDADRLATHARSEAAIHRWDVVGDDDVSRDLLGQPELTSHAVWVLNAMPGLQESIASLGERAAAAATGGFTLALTAERRPDVLVHLDGPSSRAEVSTTEVAADVAVRVRPDHRLLALWGRRPADLDWEIDGDPRLAAVVDAVLLPKARRSRA
jgi:hypothetical protein